MKKIKIAVCVILAAAMSLCLAACGEKNEAPEKEETGKVEGAENVDGVEKNRA